MFIAQNSSGVKRAYSRGLNKTDAIGGLIRDGPYYSVYDMSPKKMNSQDSVKCEYSD